MRYFKIYTVVAARVCLVRNTYHKHGRVYLVRILLGGGGATTLQSTWATASLEAIRVNRCYECNHSSGIAYFPMSSSYIAGIKLECLMFKVKFPTFSPGYQKSNKMCSNCALFHES